MKLYGIANGIIKKLEEVNDEAFSQRMMGDGIAIVPKDGKVYAPYDSEVTMVFPTNHALGLKLDNGIEVLLHIGIDTVEMNGEGFQSFVKQGDIVKKGDLLVTFDVANVIAAGYETDIMVIITNTGAFHDIKPTSLHDITIDDTLLEIV